MCTLSTELRRSNLQPINRKGRNTLVCATGTNHVIQQVYKYVVKETIQFLKAVASQQTVKLAAQRQTEAVTGLETS